MNPYQIPACWLAGVAELVMRCKDNEDLGGHFCFFYISNFNCYYKIGVLKVELQG
jgi:hypothetical protein